MTLIEKKTKEEAISKHITALKQKSFVKPDIQKLKDSIVEQIEESVFNTSQIWVELDANQNEIIDVIEDENLKYIFEGMPITKPLRDYFNKIQQYFIASERQKDKLMKRMIEVLELADTTKEIIKLVPVDSTTLGEEEIEAFKAIVRSKVIAYKDTKDKMGKRVLIADLKRDATTQEKKVWINSVAMEVLGEEILKNG